MKNKVLILVPDFRVIGGVSNYYSNLKLDAEDYITYFFVNNATENNTVKKLIGTAFRYLKFISILLVNNYKTVHINPSLDPNSFYRDSTYSFITRLCNKKLIVFFRGWDNDFEAQIKQSSNLLSIFTNGFGKATATIVLGELFKKKLHTIGYPKNHTFYIETTLADNQFDNNTFFEKKINSFNQKIKLLFISRIEKTKGIYIAIDAVKKYNNQNPATTIELNIAGTGPELEQVKDYIQNVSNINCLGSIKGEEKGKYLTESHIMIFPSYYFEGLPNSILEGMLYGMPIITRPAGATGEVVKNGINGFINESKDPNYFYECLEKICKNKELYIEIATRNRVVALERFIKEKVRLRILDIYSDLN